MARSSSTRSSSERRVLDEAGGVRAMTWVMAIMLFLTVLAAALGIGTRTSARSLERQLSGRLTVQIVEGDPVARDAAAARVLALVRALPGVRSATAVDRTELETLLRPWLGEQGADPELPIPAMIDVDLADTGSADRVAAEARRISPSARVDRHQGWMSPVTGFMATMTWLAVALVALMVAATSAVVVLAARAGLETHRATIEVMHMLGSTDIQVARLFQRRIAIDAAIGGTIGAIAGVLVVLFIGLRLQGLGSELLGGVTLDTGGWIAIAFLPLFFVLLATVAARVTVVAALRRAL
ncbi:cell division protein FtsX [Sphingomonas oligophenolica]|uniref:cell division protein FtsX n=1 Tax=Sphingomonas oligophenolica TaxID=301154 RepID=UPI001128D84E|nr:FtsX-like permease family protein [Sphingomonas oligophenolica]